MLGLTGLWSAAMSRTPDSRARPQARSKPAGRLIEPRGHVARLERRVAFGIAVLVPSFAVIGAVVLFSSEGPDSTLRRVVCVLVLLSTIPVGTWWYVHTRSIDRMPGWFVVYADLGVATALLTFASRGLALNATVLFAVIGTYIAYFSSRVVMRAHSAFISVFIVALAIATYVEGYHDALSVVARALATLLVVNSVIVFSTVIKAQLDLANTDSLTGLLNRRGFELRLERMLTDSLEGQFVAVLVVDLDRFKIVNDTYGHAAGDRVLQSTAARLADSVSVTSCVARTGGEEFTIASDLPSADAEQLAERIRATLDYSDDGISITGSVGASLLGADDWKALSPGDAAEMVHTALLRADTAMYEAKRAGGNKSQVHEA